MGIEIERKFLLGSESWRTQVHRSEHIQDGLVAASDGRKTRVRIIGARATLTVKTQRVEGRRDEFEYDIPMADAERLMECCGANVMQKVRHYIEHGGVTWEVDEYGGLLKGVILAEVEVSALDQPLALPDWVGREVTAQLPYSKTNLLRSIQQRSSGIVAVPELLAPAS